MKASQILKHLDDNLPYAVCAALLLKYHAAVSQKDYQLWQEARNQHHQDIADFRRMYHADQIKSRSDSSFVCIGIDGSDQATTYCPQIWTSHLHKDMPENSYIEQKVIAVVVHGTPDETIFYVADPRVKCGMDLTTNCLLDAITHHTDLRASTVRFQYDGLKFNRKLLKINLYVGSSENVNYSMHCMCALLVELGVFDDVFANRLPVG